MKKKIAPDTGKSNVKKGYNEHNPGQPQGAFPPGSAGEKPNKNRKSNTADKKAKEDES